MPWRAVAGGGDAADAPRHPAVRNATATTIAVTPRTIHLRRSKGAASADSDCGDALGQIAGLELRGILGRDVSVECVVADRIDPLVARAAVTRHHGGVMKETEMLHRTQAALQRSGVEDELVAAGLFLPRGHFAGAFAGGLVGDSLGGGLAGSVAT